MNSIDWLEKEIYARGPIGQDTPTWLKELYEKAKEMHKQEIIDAYGDGLNAHRTDFCNRDEYFAKTYGSKGSDEAPKCTCNVDSFLCQIHGTSDGKTITAF
jgi:hypothetical protein